MAGGTGRISDCAVIKNRGAQYHEAGRNMAQVASIVSGNMGFGFANGKLTIMAFLAAGR